MIRFALRCDSAHAFEGWFRNSDDFETQLDRKLLACPSCGSQMIQKALMAPAVSTSRRKSNLQDVQSTERNEAAPAQPAEAVSTPGPQQQAVLMPQDVKTREIVETLRSLKKQLLANSHNVGPKFAEEARKMHYGDAESRAIHGETSPAEAEALVDEGISIIPLPVLPEEKN